MTDITELLTREEELHPDLQPFLETTDVIGTVLRHPLVYSIPFFSAALANEQYRRKVEALEKAQSEQNWSTYIWMHERPYRLDAFLQIATSMSDDEYWELAGEVWIDSENIHQNQEIWKDVFSSSRANSHLVMSAEELDELEEFEPRICIWRGAISGLNELGMSWTKDPDKAEWFARRFASVHCGTAVVLEARILKTDVAAYFSRRGESEVVVPDTTSLEIVTR